MAWFVTAVLAYVRAFLLPRHELGLEVIALRHESKRVLNYTGSIGSFG
jgi:hypothetical protein